MNPDQVKDVLNLIKLKEDLLHGGIQEDIQKSNDSKTQVNQGNTQVSEFYKQFLEKKYKGKQINSPQESFMSGDSSNLSVEIIPMRKRIYQIATEVTTPENERADEDKRYTLQIPDGRSKIEV